MADPAAIVITTVLFSLIIVNIVGNSIVCAIIKKNRDMRIPMNYLLINLAIADIVYATFVAPKVFLLRLSLIHHPDGVTGTVLCTLLTAGNITWIGAASSIVTLTAISIERYYAVLYPLGNKGKLTNRKLKVIIFSSWIFALIVCVPLFFVNNTEEKEHSIFCVSIWPEEWMAKAYSVTWFLVVFLPLMLMIGLYSRVVYSLWFKHDDSQLDHQQMGVVRVRKRVTLMVVAITVIFGICWGTTSVVFLLHNTTSYTGPVLFTIVDIMVLFNSSVNPFVYALLNQQFRKKMKAMMCCTSFSAVMVRCAPKSQEIETEVVALPPSRATLQDHVPLSHVSVIP